MRWTEMEIEGWGRNPRAKALCARPEDRDELLVAFADRDERGLMARGLGRSYGDNPLIEGGRVILTERLDRMLDFDPETGWLQVEAGVSLKDIITTFAPRGWFPKVVPGTWFVTVGGAVANDIHGKNHHVAGSFADHVRQVELLTGTGEIVTCDAHTQPELFWATVGGLGLTGIMLSMEIQLERIECEWIEMESIRVRNLAEFLEVSADSKRFSHTVSWLDITRGGDSLGRGLFMRGGWARSDQAPSGDLLGELKHKLEPVLRYPITGPEHLLNKASILAFNEAFYRKQLKRHAQAIQHYEPFFFPLDFVHDWNKAYGDRGFFQYQMVVPPDPEARVLRAALEEIHRAGAYSFLAVMKEFGEGSHPWLSFPRPGHFIAMDFPNTGPELLALFERLDQMVIEAGGRVYLGKDARMSRESFRRMYPDWEEWKAVRDSWDPSGVFKTGQGIRLGLVGGAS